MRILITIAFLGIIALTLMGCSSGSQTVAGTSTGDIPDWYMNVPSDPNMFFAPNTQVSQDLQLAIDKAVQGGRVGIGQQVETKITALQKRFTEETGTANNAQLLDQFQQVSKTVVSTSLSGSKVKQQKVVKDGNNWRVYVLVEYPVGAASQALLQQIKNNEQMYTRFRATQGYKDLDEEAKKLEDSRKTQ